MRNRLPAAHLYGALCRARSAKRPPNDASGRCSAPYRLGSRDEPGSRLAGRLAMPVSGDTLLRLIRRSALEQPAAPRAIGIDEWAWRRGLTHGTILCDLEGGRIIDLLPDRKADTVAAWLRRHPGVSVITRDRAGVYAEGIRQGAPGAMQVADRWHLLRNLGGALRVVVDQHRAAIGISTQTVSAASEPAARSPTEPLVVWVGGASALSPSRVPGYTMRTYFGRPNSARRRRTPRRLPRRPAHARARGARRRRHPALSDVDDRGRLRGRQRRRRAAARSGVQAHLPDGAALCLQRPSRASRTCRGRRPCCGWPGPWSVAMLLHRTLFTRQLIPGWPS